MALYKVFPVVASFDGVAVEPPTAQGTPVAMSATVPLTAPAGWQDKPLFLTDKGMRGSMGEDYGEVAGVNYCDVSSLEGNIEVDTFGYLLANILGDVVDTGTAAPYQHAVSLMNPASSNSYTAQPNTNTWTHYDGVTPTSGARQFPGLCLSELKIMWDYATKLLTWSAKGSAWESVSLGSRPTPSPSALTPSASWIGQFAVGGPVSGTPATNLETASITISRELEIEYTGNGDQNPVSIARGGLKVATDYTFLAQDLTYYNDVMNNTQPQIQALFSSGSGAALTSLQIDMQQNALTVPKANYSKKMARWDITGKGEFNSTNVGATGGEGPITVTLKNAVTAGTYV